MDLAFNYKILVAEEFGLINYELKTMLKKKGFCVIESDKDMLQTIESKSPDLIITCLSAIKKTKGKETLIRSLLSNNCSADSTDTIVFDNNMKPLVKYPKPFNSHDIIDFILNHLNLDLKPDFHENNN